MGQRLTGMTSNQKNFPVVKSIFKFSQHGKCGMSFSELIPHIASIADDICVIKTVNTEAINHDPAITFIQTGFQQPGRPCLGSWLSYGLGNENQNLPAFIVMISSGKESDQPLYTRLWGSGFLPSEHQGVDQAVELDLRAQAAFCLEMARQMSDQATCENLRVEAVRYHAADIAAIRSLRQRARSIWQRYSV